MFTGGADESGGAADTVGGDGIAEPGGATDTGRGYGRIFFCTFHRSR